LFFWEKRVNLKLSSYCLALKSKNEFIIKTCLVGSQRRAVMRNSRNPVEPRFLVADAVCSLEDALPDLRSTGIP
jgi:hypothetical protein